VKKRETLEEGAQDERRSCARARVRQVSAFHAHAPVTLYVLPPPPSVFLRFLALLVRSQGRESSPGRNPAISEMHCVSAGQLQQPPPPQQQHQRIQSKSDHLQVWCVCDAKEARRRGALEPHWTQTSPSQGLAVPPFPNGQDKNEVSRSM
jgi:hypothetical protein